MKMTSITIDPSKIIFWGMVIFLTIDGKIPLWVTGLIALYGFDLELKFNLK